MLRRSAADLPLRNAVKTRAKAGDDTNGQNGARKLVRGE